jgi:glycosyl transferase family 25
VAAGGHNLSGEVGRGASDVSRDHGPRLPPVFVVSIPGSPRRDGIASRLRSLGLAFEFCDGVVIEREAVDAHHDAAQFRKRKHRPAFPGEIGCALAHARVWQTVLERGITTAVVLEDDMLLDDDTSSALAALAALVRQGDVVLLQYCGTVVPVPQRSIAVAASRRLSYVCRRFPLCSGAYMLTAAAAGALYTNFGSPIRTVSDDWFAFSRFVAIRAIDPPIARSDSRVPSEIGDRRVIDRDPLRGFERFRQALPRPRWSRRVWSSGLLLRVRGVFVVASVRRRYRSTIPSPDGD